MEAISRNSRYLSFALMFACLFSIYCIDTYEQRQEAVHPPVEIPADKDYIVVLNGRNCWINHRDLIELVNSTLCYDGECRAQVIDSVRNDTIYLREVTFKEFISQKDQ